MTHISMLVVCKGHLTFYAKTLPATPQLPQFRACPLAREVESHQMKHMQKHVHQVMAR